MMQLFGDSVLKSGSRDFADVKLSCAFLVVKIFTVFSKEIKTLPELPFKLKSIMNIL